MRKSVITAKISPIIKTTIAETTTTVDHISPNPNTIKAMEMMIAFDNANQQRALPTPLHTQQSFSSGKVIFVPSYVCIFVNRNRFILCHWGRVKHERMA